MSFSINYSLTVMRSVMYDFDFLQIDLILVRNRQIRGYDADLATTAFCDLLLSLTWVMISVERRNDGVQVHFMEKVI